MGGHQLPQNDNLRHVVTTLGNSGSFPTIAPLSKEELSQEEKDRLANEAIDDLEREEADEEGFGSSPE